MTFESADSRDLYEPMLYQLRTNTSEQVFSWLTQILLSQRSALRSSNATLVAYTGWRAGLEWLDLHVGSPVTTHWGEAAALLDVPWPRIKSWLTRGGAHQLMGLDALIAYRLPAPNMSPLHQIASPVLPERPSQEELESVLASVLSSKDTPRNRSAVSGILKYREEILASRERGVSVENLGQLYAAPEKFHNASAVLKRHEEVLGGVRNSIDELLRNSPKETKH